MYSQRLKLARKRREEQKVFEALESKHKREERRERNKENDRGARDRKRKATEKGTSGDVTTKKSSHKSKRSEEESSQEDSSDEDTELPKGKRQRRPAPKNSGRTSSYRADRGGSKSRSKSQKSRNNSRETSEESSSEDSDSDEESSSKMRRKRDHRRSNKSRKSSWSDEEQSTSRKGWKRASHKSSKRKKSSRELDSDEDDDDSDLGASKKSDSQQSQNNRRAIRKALDSDDTCSDGGSGKEPAKSRSKKRDSHRSHGSQRAIKGEYSTDDNSDQWLSKRHSKKSDSQGSHDRRIANRNALDSDSDDDSGQRASKRHSIRPKKYDGQGSRNSRRAGKRSENGDSSSDGAKRHSKHTKHTYSQQSQSSRLASREALDSDFDDHSDRGPSTGHLKKTDSQQSHQSWKGKRELDHDDDSNRKSIYQNSQRARKSNKETDSEDSSEERSQPRPRRGKAMAKSCSSRSKPVSTKNQPYESPDSDDTDFDPQDRSNRNRRLGSAKNESSPQAKVKKAHDKDKDKDKEMNSDEESSVQSVSSRDESKQTKKPKHEKSASARTVFPLDSDSDERKSGDQASAGKHRRAVKKVMANDLSDESGDEQRAVSKLDKKKAPANPLQAVERERENVSQMQHRGRNFVGGGDLWDDDDDNGNSQIDRRPITAPAAHSTESRASISGRPRAAKADVGEMENVGSGKNGASSSPCKNDDVVADQHKAKGRIEEHEQYPTLGNPYFGPFDNVPLKLVNKQDARSDHKVPAALARYLPPFQREGIQFLYNAVVNNYGAILGDDMGLGKTMQIIALISALLGKTGTTMDEDILKERKAKRKEVEKELGNWENSALLGQCGFEGRNKRLAEYKEKLGLPEIVPILLIVPAVVVDNWDGEIMQFSKIEVEKFRESDTREEALKGIELGSAEVLLCGHPLFGAKKHFEEILKFPWNLVVVDEFHLFKNGKSNNAKNLRILAKRHNCPIIGLTGTPMPNCFDELHNLVDLVQPKVLGTLKQFNNRIGKPMKKARAVDATQDVKAQGEDKRLELNKKLQPLYIARKKQDVLSQLPKKTEHVVLCELSELQKKTYEHIRNLPDFVLVRGSSAPCDCGVNINYFERYLRLQTPEDKIAFQKENEFIKRGKCHYREPQEEDKGMSVMWRKQHPDGTQCKRCPSCVLLPCLSKLYQLSSHLTLLQYEKPGNKAAVDSEHEEDLNREFAKISFPDDVLPELPGASYERCDQLLQGVQHFAMSGKMKKLHSLLQDIHHEKGRVLIFSYSVRMLDIIARYLDNEAKRFLRIDGKTPGKDRQGLVKQFQTDSKYFCFLLSTRAAGVGLNLTAANNVIIFDAEWNPAHDEQAQDRAYRIGQSKDVTVYRLVAQGTIEELKYLRQIYKLHLRQETFRSAEGSEAAPRSFLGVDKDTKRKGELFGAENLLSFSKDSSFLSRVWKTDKGIVAGTSTAIANAWEKGEAMMQEETEQLIRSQLEGAAKAAKKAAFDHKAFFDQGRARPANREGQMGGETQAVDDFVERGQPKQVPVPNDSDSDDSDADNHFDASDARNNENTSALGPDNVTKVASCGTTVQGASGSPPSDRELIETKTKVKPQVTKSFQQANAKSGRVSNADKPKSDEGTNPLGRVGIPDPHNDLRNNNPVNNQERQRLLQSMNKKKNFLLCGIPSQQVSGRHTTFSKANVFQPNSSN
ncbi:CHD3-type chromatin-remodeling factor [Seminavis robusta]|uniref:CHD3-type chromatin-remodeling factor n=1 Tax=Seminavis robusta TaxID=568900 RepID=A0A9N8HEC3_9STRA|nr:CHD3-type chromatin-remodeling factor [Seminavis robusta]|eukprot:Sro381_g130850.1 CHD3-type chromatin-remodeling factor (1680) ;mRNA; r:39788-46153